MPTRRPATRRRAARRPATAVSGRLPRPVAAGASEAAAQFATQPLDLGVGRGKVVLLARVKQTPRLVRLVVGGSRSLARQKEARERMGGEGWWKGSIGRARHRLAYTWAPYRSPSPRREIRSRSTALQLAATPVLEQRGYQRAITAGPLRRSLTLCPKHARRNWGR